MLTDILKSLRRLELSAQNKITSLFAGNYRSAFRGRGIEFADIRPYDTGDDVRDIDWKTSSKQGEIYVKTYHESRDNTLFFLLDTSSAMRFSSQNIPKYKVQLETFALLAFSAVLNGDRVGAFVFDGETEKIFPPKKGRRNLLKILSYCLESYRSDLKNLKKPDVNAIFKKTLLLVKQSASIFWLFGNIPDLNQSPHLQKSLRLIMLRHDLVPVLFSDPMEESLDPLGTLSFRDSFTGKSSPICIDSSLVHEYQKQRYVMKRFLEDFFRRHRTNVLFLSRSEEVFTVLFRFFQSRERRFC